AHLLFSIFCRWVGEGGTPYGPVAIGGWLSGQSKSISLDSKVPAGRAPKLRRGLSDKRTAKSEKRHRSSHLCLLNDYRKSSPPPESLRAARPRNLSRAASCRLTDRSSPSWAARPISSTTTSRSTASY